MRSTNPVLNRLDDDRPAGTAGARGRRRRGDDRGRRGGPDRRAAAAHRRHRGGVLGGGAAGGVAPGGAGRHRAGRPSCWSWSSRCRRITNPALDRRRTPCSRGCCSGWPAAPSSWSTRASWCRRWSAPSGCSSAWRRSTGPGWSGPPRGWPGWSIGTLIGLARDQPGQPGVVPAHRAAGAGGLQPDRAGRLAAVRLLRWWRSSPGRSASSSTSTRSSARSAPACPAGTPGCARSACWSG